MLAPRHSVPDDVCSRAVAGDRAAREAIVRALGPLVLGLCRRLAPHPDDAFQRVWERVFRALHRFDPNGPAKLSTWVATIAHRELVDQRRRRTRQGHVVQLHDAPSPAASVEADLVSHEQSTALQKAIDALPEPLRRIVVAHHVAGLPLATIALEEDLPVGTVKSRLHRARAELMMAMRRQT